MVTELRKVIAFEEEIFREGGRDAKDQLKIFGKDIIISKNKIIKVPDIKDHRIFQSTAILSLVTGAKARMKNFETVFTSAPSFLKIIKLLGGKFEIER